MTTKPTGDVRSSNKDSTIAKDCGEISTPSVSISRPLQQLKLLAQIHELTSQQAILNAGIFDGSNEVASKLFREIRSLANRALEDEALFAPLPGMLSEYEYMLPSELKLIHSEIVSHLASDRTNQHLAFRGLLLHGEKGTGKTEYPQFLAYCLGDAAQVVMKNVASIRNSSSPGEEIERFYNSLEERALSQGKYYIVLFDEGDQLFTPLIAEFNSSVIASSENHSKKNSQFSSRIETNKGGTIDSKGLEMMTSLKSILGRGITRVFTIVTSNRLEFPEELYREGRLLKVQFNPIGIHREKVPYLDSYLQAPIYSAYKDISIHLLKIMQATNFRIEGKANPVITMMCAEIENFFDKHVEKIFNPKVDLIYRSKPSYLSDNFITTNSNLMKSFLEFFGYPIDFKNLPWSMRDKFQFDGIESNYKKVMADFNKESPEVHLLSSCVPSTVAGYYITHRDHFNTFESAMNCFAQFIFPQLKDYSSLLEAIKVMY